ncbi:NUDIX domain-containing protein [Sphingobacterium sp. DR205]|uniref:NUDIX hydrolase n=1 Tax=Sphingobacterium sp. DR205 TaxID=2713573 RepID=UPI0013E4BD33|nr:NUDIX domain-containing protein [Sphingobacterium sp. DR205]QIH35966.1 NUDIX hydrolase [Sphingobacterium sp. DR205]
MINAQEELEDLFLKGNQDYLANISVDNVIFGYHDKELKVLLLRNPNFGSWMLPGGYIKKTEDVEKAATRVAHQRTGLDHLFLQQFKVFSTPGRNRDPHITPEVLSQLTGLKIDENHWMFQPIVSIGFYTLTEFSKAKINGSFFAEVAQWWDINTLPPLLFDHTQIILEALKALRLHIYHYPVGYELLPEKFTLPEIRALYETVLGTKIDDRNFTRKLLSLGIIKNTNELKNVAGHRPPYLYTFNKEVYSMALKDGVSIF